MVRTYTELPRGIQDREWDKFGLNNDGEVIVRTSAEGEFVFSGLSTALQITTMNVTDTAAALPTTSLTARNAISIKNLDEAESIWIGNSDVTADSAIGTTAGIKIEALGYINFDITDSITIYARAEAGKTVKVQIVELS